MSNKASAQGSQNTDIISFRVRQFTPKKNPSAIAFKIVEEKAPNPEDKNIFSSEVLSPEQFITGLVNKNPAIVVDRALVYAPSVDWYEKSSEKKQHIPAAVIKQWMDEGGKLVWNRSKVYGRKPQMQTENALQQTKAKPANVELSVDDLVF